MKRLLLYTLLFLVLFSCKEKEDPIISFYFWKTNYQLSAIEQEVLVENKVEKIYIRYFDLDLHNRTKEVFPRSPIHFSQKPTVNEIVPVVFIKNSVLLQSNLDVDSLAQKTFNYITLINTKNQLTCQEIQIDCDWSLNSKENYLSLIESFKRISKKKISATIRLHQVKYFEKTKIPNVDSGVLMYYNMGTIAVNSLNSIYDQGIAKRYISSLKKYPLPLKIALPIYVWGVHSRDHKILGLRSKLTVRDLELDENFDSINENSFEVKHSTYRKGVFYKKGDIVKIESISTSDLQEMAADLSANLKQKPSEIIFYDLDELNIKNYEKDIFKKVSTRF